MNNLAKRVAGLHIQAKSYDRIVYSPRPFSSFRSVNPKGGKRGRPQGLWYACDKEWKEFVQKYWKSQKDKYRHKYLLEVNLSRMCVLRTKQEVKTFNRIYGYTNDYGQELIDWGEVGKDYDGIEICPYQNDLKYQLSWYQGWDVAGGCIWGSSAFKSISEVDNDISDDEYNLDSEWDLS